MTWFALRDMKPRHLNVCGHLSCKAQPTNAVLKFRTSCQPLRSLATFRHIDTVIIHEEWLFIAPLGPLIFTIEINHIESPRDAPLTNGLPGMNIVFNDDASVCRSLNLWIEI